MRESQPVRILASLTIVGALAVLFFYFVPFPPRPVAPLHEGLGQTLGTQALRLLGPGGRIFVIVRETTEFDSPATQMQLRGFRRTLQQAGHAPSLTRRVRSDPRSVVQAPTGDFLALLKKTWAQDVVVSFMGPPDFDDRQIAELGGARARVVALCTGSMPQRVDLHRLFTNDLLHAAILTRREASVPLVAPETPQAWFDRFYFLVTATNLADVPRPVVAQR
jgi:hypothetical protein